MVKLNRRVTVKVYGSTLNDQGGPEAVLIDSWEKWAQIENRTGTNSNPYQQQVWQYDYKVTMRFEKTRATKSNYEIEYENTRMKIENVSIEEEGFKQYEVCRCSKIDELITTEQSSS